jgi:flavin-dependent dehydrogenase
MQFLKRYQKLWTAEIGKEINKGMQFRKIFQRLTDKQIDKYLTLLQEPKILNIITRYGDIDYPTKLIKPLITKVPSLIRLLPHIIRR